MIAHKRFCKIIVFFVFSLLLYNTVVWHCWTKRLLTRYGDVFVGDLVRMGYLPKLRHERKNVVDLPAQHLDISQYHGQKVDLVTIGDSFSQGMAFGKNRFYQDYIVSNLGLSVLNLPPYPGTTNLLESVALLLNSGYLDEIKPRYILLEIVERNCIKKLPLEVNLSRKESLETVKEYYAKMARNSQRSNTDLPPVGFFNSGNLKFLFNQSAYLVSDHAISSKVYQRPMDRKLFSGKMGEKLLFLKKDVAKLRHLSVKSVAKSNENLNRLALLLRNKGIELYFMPVVNKYSLYRSYIIDNPYPESHFFGLLKSEQREYNLIDTQTILKQEIEKGEKDIFYIDDTHWSWKASKAIFSQVQFD